jgi:hypothetical protein
VQGALACGDTADCVRREMAKRRDKFVVALRERFERAVKEKDLLPTAVPADLARFVATILQGMSVQAVSGAQPTRVGTSGANRAEGLAGITDFVAHCEPILSLPSSSVLKCSQHSLRRESQNPGIFFGRRASSYCWLISRECRPPSESSSAVWGRPFCAPI